MLLKLVMITFVFIIIVGGCEAILDPKDYLALQSIRKSLTDLPGSTFFTSWDFTADPCASFSGVTCSGDRVISLSLGDPRAGAHGLTGRLSPSLGDLSALLSLSLVPGRVFGRLPITLARCNRLRFLALSRNFLSGEIPGGISSLRSLKTLDLSFNLLSGEIPNLPPPLSNLILSHNHLTGKIPKLPPLTRLDLKRNNLSGEIPNLPLSLRYLSLSTNQLAGGIFAIRSLTSLNYLDLSFNRLTGEIPPEIFSFSISDLYLQRNGLSGRVRVSAPVKMDTIDLSYNRLSGRIPAELAEAERLYLNSNRFVGDVPGRFVERVMSAGITVLFLQHNFLTGFGGFGGRSVPASVSLCVQYNCMAPPKGMVCPARVGAWRSRPAGECRRWRRLVKH